MKKTSSSIRSLWWRALLVALAPMVANALTVTNGNFEGTEFYTNPQPTTAATARDCLYRAQYTANGAGWYNSNNGTNWDRLAGGPSGTGFYGAKDATANHRGLVNVITDGRQTKGVVQLNAKVLHRAFGGNEALLVKVWGVRESTAGQWDGWVDLTGPTGNNDGLDVRNFNNALAPDNAGQQASGGAVSYTGTDFTLLASHTAATLGITTSESWQSISFSFDLGQTGYDQIIVGFSYHDTSGTPSGVDDLTVAIPPIVPVLTANPQNLAPGQSNISLTWTAANTPAGATFVITSNRAGYGPYNVTAQTSGGSSTSPLVVPYDPANGDVTFTLTATNVNTGSSYTSSTTVMVPRPEPQLVATPSQLTPSDHQISLTWSTANYPANASVVINSNRVGIGPFNVSAMTGANGSSTQTLVIPYNQAIGNVTFTITVTNPATGISGSYEITVTGPASTLPNVLMVLVDDMGWADIAPYGGEIQTPNLTRLANNGLRFREFHNEARCSPTRCALLTGLHMQSAATEPNEPLPPLRIDNNVTIAEMLRSVGYRTYEAGKWHISEYMDQAKYTTLSSPTNRGFGYAFNSSLWGGHLADHNGEGKYWSGSTWELCPSNSEITPIRYDGTDTRASRVPFYKTDAEVDYVLEYLNHHLSKNDDKPFFIYLAHNAPHFSLQAPKEYINLYTDVADSNPGDTDIYRYEDGWDLTRQRRFDRQLAQGILPAGTRLPPMSPAPGGSAVQLWTALTQTEKDDQARRMATYAAMVHDIDINLGRIIAKLEQTGQLDNTIIAFMSDNGGNYEGGLLGGGSRLTGTALAEMGQDGQTGINLGGSWANVNNTPFRYFKHHTQEGGCRTPMIVHWPAGMSNGLKGKWTDERGHAIDFMPTFLAAAGIRYPERFAGHAVDPMQGISLLPVLTGGKLPVRDLTIEHERNRALFRGDWKLMTKTFSSAAINELPADTAELYNLKEDPTEMNNLAFHRPQMLTEMVGRFNSWVDSTPGLNADRHIAAVTTEPSSFVMPRGKELFVDQFNRSDVDDLDSAQGGMSGVLIGMNQQPLNNVYYEGFNPSGSTVSGSRLRMTGMSENGLRFSVDSPQVTQAGGFAVGMEIKSIVSPFPSANDYVGFGVGLTQAEAQGGASVNSAGSFRGNNTLHQGTADFFVELNAMNEVVCWIQGVAQPAVQVGATQGKLVAAFTTPGGFASGAAVQVKVLFNNVPIYSGSLNWGQNGCGYIGLSSNTGTRAELDNLVVSGLPLLGSFMGDYLLSHGVSDEDAGADQDPDGDGASNAIEWMLGTNPALADDPLKGALEIQYRNPNGIELLHRRARGYSEAGAKYDINVSSDFTSWSLLSPAQVSTMTDVAGYERAVLTLPEPLRSAPRLFFKFALSY